MTRVCLNKPFGRLMTIAEAVKHLAEHPKATFYSRINSQELIIVTENGKSRFEHLTEKKFGDPSSFDVIRTPKEPDKDEKPQEESKPVKKKKL